MNVEGDVRAADARVVRVFVSSPSDVAAERGRVQSVAAKLNREYQDLVRFETLLWEEHFYKADRSFQPQIAESMACDVVVSIFWTRIGTELPHDFQRLPDGRPYPSGTAYELLTALDASKSKGVPDVYVFRKIADAVLPITDAERRRQAQTQFDALEAFWSEWFKAENGQFRAAFHTFASADEFERQLEELLRQWLHSRRLLGPRLAWPKEKGAPFRGLSPFEAEHATVFFGRDRAIDEARRRLVEAAERGSPFLLIIGASGVGKSSLARAGLIPRLTTPGMVASVDIWRVARLKPSEGQAGPLLALATALFVALPELDQGDYPTPPALADNLRRGGEAATPVERALSRVAKKAQCERHADSELRSALVLLVDQLEELFGQAVGDADSTAFTENLKQLVEKRVVWCIATLRADLYELMLNQPGLIALKEAGASLDLGPPREAELAEIVRAPAKAAGLVFERDPQKGYLDDRLLADAGTADSLPLLQFTLSRLYDQGIEADGQIELTHADYEVLGRLEGAIAQEAERAIKRLPAERLNALPRLLRRLAEPARDGKSLTWREVYLDEIKKVPAENALAQALLEARILIAGSDASAHPTVRLAHDAVFSSWPRAKAAAQASRDFFRVRAEVEHALRRWQEHARLADLLIPRGVPLEEAEKLIGDFGSELPAELIAYVTASRYRARRGQRIVAGVAAGMSILFILAVAASLYGKIESLRAKVSQSRFDTSLSQKETAAGNGTDGILLALKALSAKVDGRENVLYKGAQRTLEAIVGMKTLPEAEVALFTAVQGNREKKDFPGQHLAVFSPDGNRILTASDDDKVRVWDTASGRILAVLQGHTGPVTSVAFSPDGTHIVTASDDKTARVWDATSGHSQAVLKGHAGPIWSAAFSPDSTRIVTASEDKTAQVWDVASGRSLVVLKGHTCLVRRAEFNRDGTRIATASNDNTARLWDASSGRDLAVLRGLPGQDTGSVFSAEFSPDGTRIVTASDDKTARVWDGVSGRSLALLQGHDKLVRWAAFSRDGTRIVTASDDQTARVWDAASGRSLLVLNGHNKLVRQAMFSPDGNRIVTASDDQTARVWDAASGRNLVVLNGHINPVYSALFSPDGTSIVTASYDNTVRLWDTAAGPPGLVALKGHEKKINSAVFSPNGTRIVTASDDQTARVWDTASGRSLLVLNGHTKLVRQAMFSPDGNRIVTASDDQTARVWDAASGRTLAILQGHKGTVNSAAFSPDGTHIVTASSDKTAQVWDAASGHSLAVLKGHREWVDSAAFSLDGTRIVTASDDTTAQVWDTSGRSLVGLKGHTGPVNSATFNRDGTRIVTASNDTTAQVWDAASGRSLAILRGHKGAVKSATFSPDGTHIVTASDDCTVRVWDTASGRSLVVVPGAVRPVNCPAVNSATFSRDGARIVTASDDTTAQVWRLFPSLQSMIQYATDTVPRHLTSTELQLSFTPNPDNGRWQPPTVVIVQSGG
jgi:WD40 repeat protein